MLPDADRYETLLSRVRWDVPAHYNIAADTCDKWADGSGRLALIHETAQGDVARYTFDDLKNASNRLANSFARAGLHRGDRIGIFLAQGPETAIAHLAAYKLGAIAVPLFTLFGADALEYRLANSEAAALVTDAAGYAKIAPLRTQLPALHTIYCVGDDTPDTPGVLRFDTALADASAEFTPADTAADDPALII
jgi:acetyl-CoA synthetase